MLAQIISMIRSENHNGIVRQSEVIQTIQNPAEALDPFRQCLLLFQKHRRPFQSTDDCFQNRNQPRVSGRLPGDADPGAIPDAVGPVNGPISYNFV